MSIPDERIQPPNEQSEDEKNGKNNLRITNNTEGTKKQKEATKKLSAYNEEVRLRTNTKEHVDEVEEEEEKEKEEAPPSQDNNISLMSMTNIIAVLGLVATAGCLHYSYKTDRREEEASEPSPKKSPEIKHVEIKTKRPKFRTL